MLDYNDPQSAALTLAATLLGPGTSFGDRLSRGLLGAQQTAASAQDAAMKRAYYQALQEQSTATAEERRAKVAEAERARQAKTDFAGLFRPQLPANFDMRAPGAANAAPQVQITPELILAGRNAGYSLEDLKAMVEAKNWGRDKVARTVEVTGPDGKPATRQMTEYGEQIGADLPKPYERKLQDLGGTVTPFDPYTGTAAGQAIAKSMTPGERASNAVAWSNNALARQRLALEQQQAAQGKWANDLERGLQINAATGETRPITAGGQPIGAKVKEPTEGQAATNIYAQRAMQANRIIDELGDSYSPWKVASKVSAASVPVIGGPMGALSNKFVMNANDQRAEQAQRDFINAVLRKESGAVISDSEFDSARKQYFPQPGDAPAVIEQKRRTREIAVQGLAAAAGPAMQRFQIAPAVGARGNGTTVSGTIGAPGSGWSIQEVR